MRNLDHMYTKYNELQKKVHTVNRHGDWEMGMHD